MSILHNVIVLIDYGLCIMRIECFISYEKDDRDIAIQIIERLQSESIEPWWDEKLSLVSDELTNDIKGAILNSQCFLVIWTENSVHSTWLRDENLILHDDENGRHKIVALAINEPLIPSPFNTNQVLNVQIKNNRIIDENELIKIIETIKSQIGIIGKNEHIICPRILGESWGCHDLAIEGPVPGSDLLLSFRPCGESGTFLLMHFDSTDGWVIDSLPGVDNRHRALVEERSVEEKSLDEKECEYTDNDQTYLKIKNDVYFIRDPIRPYSIQIGAVRSMKPNAKPGIIEGNMTEAELIDLPTHLYWLSLTLAEILQNEETLKYLWQDTKKHKQSWGQEKYKQVRDAISKNPFSSMSLQQSSCRFCTKQFKDKRQLSKKYGATLIANDFPFGPNFHYIAIVDEPVHSWEHLSYKQVFGLNKITHDYLQIEENRFASAGIQFGFNSTVRHLVLGARTQSSAGASIPHIHKQVWGMAPRTSNLAEQLISVCEAYANINIDYQACYLRALKDADYIIWEDDYIALYVPYGQCSQHELQSMVKRPCANYVDFNQHEIESMSKAEFIVLQLYKILEISSFNNILISKLFNDSRAPNFRVVQSFVTREVDLAVSELSLLYVVDQHPRDSRNKLVSAFNQIKNKIKAEFKM